MLPVICDRATSCIGALHTTCNRQRICWHLQHPNTLVKRHLAQYSDSLSPKLIVAHWALGSTSYHERGRQTTPSHMHVDNALVVLSGSSTQMLIADTMTESDTMQQSSIEAWPGVMSGATPGLFCTVAIQCPRRGLWFASNTIAQHSVALLRALLLPLLLLAATTAAAKLLR